MRLNDRLQELEDTTGGMQGKMIHPFYQGGIFLLTILLALWSGMAWVVRTLLRRR